MILTTLESLTESTVRSAAASRGSFGAIQALGSQLAVSIEMGKNVTANLCRALAKKMREVLTGVLKSREQSQEPRPAAATVTGIEEPAALGGVTPAAKTGTKEMKAVEVTVTTDFKPKGTAAGGGGHGERDEEAPPEPVFSDPGLLPVPTA
ncbi:unnamed protein product [Linum trigynum]|uniref:Uncharacterized protein n=1 Tax=Linum trigynum TaxID=586398 RepID=A0AAV2FCY2_9ROSI